MAIWGLIPPVLNVVGGGEVPLPRFLPPRPNYEEPGPSSDRVGRQCPSVP